MFADVLEEAVHEGDADQQPAYLVSRLKAALRYATASAKLDTVALTEARSYATRLLARQDLAPENRRKLQFIETMIGSDASMPAVRRTADELVESMRGPLTERVELNVERSFDDHFNVLLVEDEAKI